MPAHYDLHIHSQRSFDSRIPLKQLGARALELGLAGFAVTDHDLYTCHRSPYPGLLVIPGEEVSTLEGHILALGINEEIPPWLSPEETIDLIHGQGALAVASHPFSSKEGYPGLGEKVYELSLDGLEVTNPKRHVDNKQARKAAATMGVTKVGGSDAHRLEDVGQGVTVLREPVETVDDFLDIVRRGHCDGVTKL